MSVSVSEVRSETQIPASVISDTDVNYIIDKVGVYGINAVCSYVLRLVLRKYRGRTRIRIGNVWESIDPQELRRQIREYESLGGAVPKDTIENPDAFFTRDGL